MYGRSAGLVMESVRSRGGDPTVNLEGAACTGRGPGGRGVYDWGAKIVVQIAARELPELVAVLHGWQTSAEGAYHMGAGDGVARGWRARTDEAGTVRLAVFQPGASHTVALELHDRLEMAMLTMRRLALRYPGVAPALLHATLRGMLAARGVEAAGG